MFFTTPWTTLVPSLTSADQAWLLNQAANRLKSLGRLTEAVEPMKAALELVIEGQDWRRAATVASNLSELELTRGEVAAAVNAGEQAVTYADRSGKQNWREFVTSSTMLADALHQAGRREESRRLFKDAESRQAENQPEFPQLYSLRGFQYCDLLLSDAERTMWQSWLSGESGSGARLAATIADCEIARDRASRALSWAEQRRHPLLDIALNYLILARADRDYTVRSHIETAVEKLHAAGTLDQAPRALLTRARLLSLSGDEEASRADLDEAWEIAERGPMPLFQADIQLTRGRLFRDRVALAEARHLIEKHGYHRRDEELADAEAAARAWPHPPSPSPIALPPAGRGSAATQNTDQSEQSEDSMPDQVFISYSHRDKKFMEELQTHLKPYLRSGAITPWSDKQIAPGSQWFDEIQGGLSKAGAAVLLVSPDFLASDFIHEHELGPLLKEAKAGGVKILWVPLRPSAYEKTPLKAYQAVSSPDKPLAQMSKPERDSAWVEICKKIERAVASSRNSAAAPGTVSTPAVTTSTSSPGIGGSAVKVWQEKLAFLLEEEAIASDPIRSSASGSSSRKRGRKSGSWEDSLEPRSQKALAEKLHLLLAEEAKVVDTRPLAFARRPPADAHRPLAFAWRSGCATRALLLQIPVHIHQEIHMSSIGQERLRLESSRGVGGEAEDGVVGAGLPGDEVEGARRG